MGRIYVLVGAGQLTPLEEAPYELEEVLQKLLAEHPDLLAGEQMTPESPRRWLLVRREAGVPDEEGAVGRWAVDHLFLDQDGVPTLVEVKRSSDTRLRREVVGQLLDYAANAVVYWPADSLREQFETQQAADGYDSDAVIGELLGPEGDPEEFWERVRTNLQAQRVRMIFVADVIPRELRRIVEFLNEQMDPAEVLAVEIRQYVGDGLKTLVPRVIGVTAEAEQRKGRTRRTRRTSAWTAEEFDADLSTRVDAEAVELARRIRAWATEQGLDLTWGQGLKLGTFYAKLDCSGDVHPTFGVFSDGKIEVEFQNRLPPFDERAMRKQLADRLNVVPEASFSDDTLDTWASMRLTALSDPTSMQQFFATWEWYIQQVQAANG